MLKSLMTALERFCDRSCFGLACWAVLNSSSLASQLKTIRISEVISLPYQAKLLRLSMQFASSVCF